jgi:hypothetical protein
MKLTDGELTKLYVAYRNAIEPALFYIRPLHRYSYMNLMYKLEDELIERGVEFVGYKPLDPEPKE